jgi:hypothetical protein
VSIEERDLKLCGGVLIEAENGSATDGCEFWERLGTILEPFGIERNHSELLGTCRNRPEHEADKY